MGQNRPFRLGPSWSLMTIRTFAHRLGVCCDRSAWMLSYLRPFPTFSSPIRRMAPPAWSSTSGCRGRAVLILSASSPRRTGNCQSSSSQGTATSRCRCKMKGGAIEFLTKPFRDQDLLDAIQLGLSRDRVRRENEKALAALRKRFESLSPREREIMIQVARGRLGKQIAGDIGIAEATVKGASQPFDAKDEGPFASRAMPNGG
jgi:hypothetical protein